MSNPRHHLESDDIADVPTEGMLPAMETTPTSRSKTPRRLERHQRIERWRTEREMPTKQLVGVVRHTERADSCWSTADSLAWQNTADFEKWPTDPPLSMNGVKAAKEIGRTVCSWAQDVDSAVHVVISSPYLRCIQTAAEIADTLGTGTRLLVDLSLGEVYGPSVMGDNEPLHPTRPRQEAQSYLERLGLQCKWEVIGSWPVWPETLTAARWRFASRFLKHLHRSLRVRRNCLLVSHGECVGVTLSIMPSQVEAGSQVEKVDFGGMFLANRSTIPEEPSPCASLTMSQVPSEFYCSSSGTSSYRFSRPSSSAASTRTTLRGSTPRQSLTTPGLSAPRLSGACRKPLTVACRQRNNDEEWDVADERAEDSAAVFAQGEDVQADETWPKPSGWQVQTYNVMQHKEESENSLALEKKMRSLEEKTAYTPDQLNLLLGQLFDQPLSIDFIRKEDDDLFKPVLSEKSTFLFGASHADLALIGAAHGRGSHSTFKSDNTKSGEGLSCNSGEIKTPKKTNGDNKFVNGAKDNDLGYAKPGTYGKMPILLNCGINSKIGQRRKRFLGGGTSSPSS